MPAATRGKASIPIEQLKLPQLAWAVIDAHLRELKTIDSCKSCSCRCKFTGVGNTVFFAGNKGHTVISATLVTNLCSPIDDELPVISSTTSAALDHKT